MGRMTVAAFGPTTVSTDGRRRSRLLICDDHVMFTDSLAVVLESHGYEVVAQVTRPELALAHVAHADVCLMDRTFPNGNGIDAIESVRTASPHTKVVMLSGSSDPVDIARAKAAGAAGYVVKDDDIEQVVAAIEGALSGQGVWGARHAHLRTRARQASVTPAQHMAGFLTAREREVLHRLVNGESTAAIGKAMGVTYSTVRTHIQNVLTKLGVHSKLEAVAFATSNGLLKTGADGDRQFRFA